VEVRALRSRDQRIHAIPASDSGASLPRTATCGARLVREDPLPLIAILSFRFANGERPFNLRMVCIACLHAVSPDHVPTLLLLRGRKGQTHSSTEVWSGAGAEGIDIADREGKVRPVERDGSRPEKPAYPIVGDTSRRGPKGPKQRR
jgi:hypothetical protein